ncbi:MAG: hypothetical protein AAF517_00090, partial [Planctomycetota bacterium]
MKIDRRRFLLLVFFFVSLEVRAEEANPLEALRAGRVSAGARLRAGAFGELRPTRSVSLAGRVSVRVAEDGRFRAEGVTAAKSVRVELHTAREDERLDSGSRSRLRTSEATEVTGDLVRCEVVEAAEPPLFDLELLSSESRRRIPLSGPEATAAVRLHGFTSNGDPVDRFLAEVPPIYGLALAPAHRFVLGGDGTVSALENGVGFLRAYGDGEWTQLLVDADDRIDSDGDGLPDVWEREHGLDPTRDDASEDADRDGLTNLEEYRLATRPDRADSDGDTLTDGDEVLIHGTDPLNPDTDGDFSPDEIEVLSGSDPQNPNDRGAAPFDPSVRLTRRLNGEPAAFVVGSNRNALFVIHEDGEMSSFRVDRSQEFALPFQNSSIEGTPVHAVLMQRTLDDNSLFIATTNEVIEVALGDGVFRGNRALAGSSNPRALAAQRDLLAIGHPGGVSIYRYGVDATEEIATLDVGAVDVVAMNGDLVFAGRRELGSVAVIDLRDPSAPFEVTSLSLPESADPMRRMVATADALYVAHGGSGILSYATRGEQRFTNVDSSLDDRPGESYSTLAMQGDRLIAYPASAGATVSLFRMEDGGLLDFEEITSVGLSGLRDLATFQNVLVSLNGDFFSVTDLLPRGDFDERRPFGRVYPQSFRTIFPEGTDLPVIANARDDVYTERVEFELNGTLRTVDYVPPFEMVLENIEAPSTVTVRAIAYDLGGTLRDLGSAVIQFDLDGDGDGNP